MSSRRRIPSALIVTLIVAACGMPVTAPPDGVATQLSTTTATVETMTAAIVETKKADNAVVDQPDSDCPVTIPPQPGFDATKPKDVSYTEHFPAPDPWPGEYPHEGMVWYGTEGLWTALAIDGHHSPRKSVWWSVNFPGGVVEERPDVTVTWTRLDTDEPVVIDNGGKATNAFTPEEGWFMIAGGDPNEPGCWEVEATYKGGTLSYVYEKTG